MKILVSGGRDYNDREHLFAILDEYLGQVTILIHGGASGADTLAGEWGQTRGIPVQVFPANWLAHGKAAGPIRNQQMLTEGKPDLVLLFPGGRGTQNMGMLSRKAGCLVRQV